MSLVAVMRIEINRITEETMAHRWSHLCWNTVSFAPAIHSSPPTYTLYIGPSVALTILVISDLSTRLPDCFETIHENDAGTSSFVFAASPAFFIEEIVRTVSAWSSGNMTPSFGGNEATDVVFPDFKCYFLNEFGVAESVWCSFEFSLLFVGKKVASSMTEYLFRAFSSLASSEFEAFCGISI